MRHRSRLLWLVLCAAHTLPILADDPVRIGTITIETQDVYSSQEAARGNLYRLTDKLHRETRPSVIRNLLLFREGDPYVAERLAETERNLRSLGFLKAASVIAGPPHDGLIDVVVRTQDGWSLEPGTEAGSKGGVSTFGFSLTDSNLAGLGRHASISFHRGVDRSRAAIEYRDPSFLRPYWQARMTYAQNSDGFERRVSLGPPFYSLAQHWSYRVSFDDVRQDDRLYGQGRITEQFSHQRRQALASTGYALVANDQRALRLFGGVRFVSDTFSPSETFRVTTIPPVDRAFRYLFFRLERAENRFIKLNYVNRDVRYEDFNLGHLSSIEGAISPRAFGLDRTTGFVRIADSVGGWMDDGNAFILPSASFESRIDHGFRNAIFTTSVRYVRRVDGPLPRTVVARVLVNAGWNLDREVQFFADGGEGLRGYRLHSFAGSRNLIINLEQRLYLGGEFLQLLSPGIVVFVDGGKATNGNLFRASGFKADVGAGIRLGLPRSPKNLIRIDAAYALSPDVRGKRGVLISFSSGQAF